MLLLASLLGLVYSGGWEYSVRRYLDGFSDAIVPNSEPAERQVEAILDWMRKGPPRMVASNPSTLPGRDPETTLNYQQLLSVCGTATNAFLNLARSNGLSVRRLLLLSPEGKAKHVVAEVLIGGRWVIADPAYRILMRDAKGRLVRLSRLPLEGLHLRWFLDKVVPGWEERVDWTLLLERESFFALCVFALASFVFLLLRLLLGWYADHRLKIPRFRFRAQFMRARMAFFSAPEIK